MCVAMLIVVVTYTIQLLGMYQDDEKKRSEGVRT